MLFILFACILICAKADRIVIPAEYKHLCWQQHRDHYPNLFDIFLTKDILEFSQLYLSRASNNTIKALIQGGEMGFESHSTELNALNRTLIIEAKMEISLESIGATIVLCMMPLQSTVQYMCMEFRNVNITLTISNNLRGWKQKFGKGYTREDVPLRRGDESMRGSVLDIVDKSKDDCVNVPLDSSQDDDKKRKKKKLSDYEIIKVLGRGSFGEVVLAEQKHTKNLYALKMMDLNLCKTLFENERMILKIARNQPFLVGYHATFTTSENMIIAMDFVNGGDLRSLIKKLDKIPENHVRFYVAELLLGLTFLHSRGIVHRDLKPGNIKIDQEGHIRIADFGLGKVTSFFYKIHIATMKCLSCGKKIKGRCGTRAYLATEILRGGSYDFREDIWALGVTMFEMLTGERPFDMKLRRNPWQGIVDRDLKPENVKLEVVIWRITDFGLSKKMMNRLGANPSTTIQSIASMPFYSFIN
ncbi:unnamed protein product [Gordionus sp. m RMFG-2023]